MGTIRNARGHIKPAASSLATQMSAAPVWGEDAAQQADRSTGSTSCRQLRRAENLLLAAALLLSFWRFLRVCSYSGQNSEAPNFFALLADDD